MKDRFILVFYALGLIFLSSLSSVKYLFFVCSLLLFANILVLRKGFRKRVKPFTFALFTTLFISTPYGLWTGNHLYIPFITLRMVDLMLLTLLALSHINIYSALGFSRTLSQLLLITSSHILLYRKVFWEFKEALKSRSPEGPKRREVINFFGSIGVYFFDKSLRDSEEITKAMKSRGFELD